MDRLVMAFESGTGFFRPTSISVAGDAADLRRIQAIAGLLASAGPFSAVAGGTGSDIRPLMLWGVPTLSRHSGGERYMYYHHADADMADKVDPDEMAHGVAVPAL